MNWSSPGTQRKEAHSGRGNIMYHGGAEKKSTPKPLKESLRGWLNLSGVERLAAKVGKVDRLMGPYL